MRAHREPRVPFTRHTTLTSSSSASNSPMRFCSASRLCSASKLPPNEPLCPSLPVRRLVQTPTQQLPRMSHIRCRSAPRRLDLCKLLRIDGYAARGRRRAHQRGLLVPELCLQSVEGRAYPRRTRVALVDSLQPIEWVRAVRSGPSGHRVPTALLLWQPEYPTP